MQLLANELMLTRGVGGLHLSEGDVRDVLVQRGDL